MLKKIYQLTVLLLFLGLFSFTLKAQISEGGTPPSFLNKTRISNVFDERFIESINVTQAMQEDALRGGPMWIGRSVPVNLDMNCSGTWTDMPDGKKIWRLRLTSPGAQALAVCYNNFYIPEGGKLFLYNASETQIIGAFTSANNPAEKLFSTELIQGESVVLEYVAPADLQLGQVQPIEMKSNPFGNSSASSTIPYKAKKSPIISISEIVYVYRKVPFLERFNTLKTTGWGASEACEVNVNCSPAGDNWQDEKRGVAEIFLNDNGSWGWCSGTLVNTTNNSGIPYFLTANHCGGSTATDANLLQWQFYFKYEAPSCTTPGTEPAYSTIVQCVRKATGPISGGSDFFLVQLNTIPPASFNPYYNGWDRTNTTWAAATVGIHHPAGDIKKISYCQSALVSSSPTIGGSVMATNSAWRVTWGATGNGTGVTEGGSSGSPLFNSVGRQVGTLSGGSSTCATPTSSDYYGKFYYHWDLNGAADNVRLKPWLDPTNTGVTFVNGYDPYAAAIAPVANFSATPLTVVAGQSVQFTDLSSNAPTSWAWTFPSGYPATSTNRNPSVSWVTPGTYTITLTATNAFGSDAETKTAYITVTAYTAPTSPVIIGTGTNTANFPYGITNTQSFVRSASIYLNTEVGTNAGRITSLAYYVNTARTNSRNIKIYMKHTTETAFTTAVTDDAIISDATLVYDGTFIPTPTGWFNHTLQTPFNYNGSNNLMVIVFVDATAANTTSANRYSTATNRHQQWAGTADPTAVGTINSNRPNIQITLSGYTAPVANFAGFNPIISEDFEGTTFPPTGWIVTDVDGANSTWASSSDFNHTFNGSKSAAHAFTTTPLQNGYLITSQLTAVPAGASLSFWSYNEYPTYYGATYQGVNAVLISTTGTAPANFTQIWSPTTVTASWVQTILSLSAYAGQNIYIAFRYGGLDAHNWFLDDVIVSTENYTQITTYEGDPLTIYDKSTNNPTLWEWTNTGGVPTSQTNQNASLTYNVAGLYPVTLKAANPAGQNTKTVANFVNVIGRAPIPDFNGAGNLKTINLRPFIPMGGTVTYTDLSTRVPTAWTWTFTGGSPASSAVQAPTAVTYSSAGKYPTTLYVSNAHGNNTGTATDYVVVGGTDTCTNWISTDGAAAYTYTNGLIPGHAAESTGEKFWSYAEFFQNAYSGTVNKIVMGIYKAQGAGKNVTFYVWDGSTGSPGTVLGSKTVAITTFTEAAMNTLVFDAPIPVTGNFFIGYTLSYDATHNYTTHQFCPYMSAFRNTSIASTGYFAWGATAPGTWSSFESGFGNAASLMLEPEFTYTYTGPTITATATPGCGTGSVTITSSVTANQTFYLTDNAGATLQTWTGNTNTHIFTALADGVYRGKTLNGTIESALSAAVTLTNNVTTAITTQPITQTVCPGVNVTFTVAATGTSLTYQWRKAGANITGATAATYTITGVVAGNAGNYDCIVTGTCGTVTSNVAVLTVNTTTAITTQPITQTVCAGTNVTFTVAATGTSLTYQWRKGGTNITGATSASYTITGVVAGDAGSFDCVVTGTCGNVTSTAAVLTVNAVTAITTQPITQTVCAGTNVTFTVAATGTSLTYQWRKGGTNITGATTATYSITGVTAAAAGSYDCVVTGTCGNVTSTAAVLTVNAATVITTQPITQTVCAGTNVTFTVAATGTALTYQWRKGGTNITGATTTSYTITGVTAASAGSYDCVVTGTCGNVTSTAAVLTVNAATAITTQPLTQTICAGTNVTFTVAATGASLTYQWRKGGANITGATTASYTITGVVAGDAGSFDCVVAGACGNVTSAAAVLTVNAATVITTQPITQTVCAGTNVTFTVAATGTGLTYQWRKGGTNITGATSASYTITGVTAASAGNFDCVVTGTCGNVTSNLAVLTVNAVTAITTQPITQTVCAGTNVTFTVAATGTSLTYQWRKGGTNITGATAATYTITGVVAGDAGSFDCVVTGTCGNVTSAAAVLTVNAATVITTQPITQTVCAGTNVTFTVAATGTGLSYQWRKGGTNITGATSASYTITGVTAASAGNFDCVVTGTCGNVTSNLAVLTVNAVTAITTQPITQTVCAGTNVTFTVAATGTSLTYQWRKGGTNITGATAASYTITGVVAGDAGSYDVIVTGTCGNVTSAAAVLTVNAATVITTQPITQTVCPGTNVTFTVAATGTSLTYQWRKGGANITGATSASYTITGVVAGDAGTYDVVVTGTCGNVTSAIATLTVNQVAAITTQPISQTVCPATSVTFTVVATGTGLTYQWKKGVTNITGATSASYTIASVAAGDAGNYTCVVTGTCGNVTSNIATLTVNTATAITTQPITQTVCAGTNVTFTVAATGTALTYQWRKGGTNIPGANSATYTITGVTTGDAGNYDVVVTGTCGNVTSTSATLTVNAVTVITTQPLDQSACVGTNVTFTVAATGTGLTYQWRKGGANITGATSASYTITSVVAGSAGNYDCIVTGSCGNVTSDVATLTITVSLTLTSPVDQLVCSGSTATFTVIANGSSPTYVWKKNGTAMTNGGNVSGVNTATLTIANCAAGDVAGYTCDVTSACGNATSTVAQLTLDAATVITTQPIAVTVCAGGNATFTVVATGSGTLTYQWRKGGTNIPGANTASFTITGVSAADAGSYDVIVTGTCGNVTSTAAALTVNAVTAITTQPATQTVCAGTNVTLTVAATGTSLSYQWRKGGSNITGATSASYTISGVAAGDAGTYDVVVTGTCGNITSNAAILTVNAATAITTQPAAQAVCAGSNVTFNVVAAGTGLSYQWRKDGSNITGATAANYSISGVVAGDAGNYDVVITGTCGNITSATAALTVSAVTAINTQPTTQTVCEGSNVTLTVAATGTGLTYQWRKGGANITGATLATYSITGVALGDAGNYDCVVTGTCGNVTSNVAVLTVNANVLITGQPLTQTVCVGSNVSFNLTVSGTVISYQWRKDGANITGATTASYSISGVDAADAGSYDCIVTGSCGAVTSSAGILTVNAATLITGQPVGTTVCEGSNASFIVVADGSNLTFQWRKDGVDITGAVASSYSITGVTAADAANYDVVVTGSCGTATSGPATLVVNAATSITTQPAGQTLCEGSNVTLSVVAAGAGLTYQWTLNGTNITGATSASYSISGVATADAGTYACAITGTCGSVTSSNAVLSVNEATVITTQPAAVSLCDGSDATFNVVAAGSNLSYQWRFGTVDITGATSATYSITGATSTDAGSYVCVVTGDCGVITSDVAILTVNLIPQLSTSTTNAGCGQSDGTATVTITSGSGTNTYLWSDASAQTLATASNLPMGTYTVTVNNGNCSNVASASISEAGAPTITIDPTSATVCEGQNVTITANGADSYSWSPADYLDNTNTGIVICTPGATTTYTVTGTTAGCSSQAQITVSFSPLPVAGFTFTSDMLVATVTDASQNATSWEYTMGEGTTLTDQNPVHTYPYSGTFTITQTVSNTCGTDVLAQDITVLDISVPFVSDGVAFNVYPNPGNGICNLVLNAPSVDNFTIRLINNLGQVVYTGDFTKNNSLFMTPMNFSNLAKGVYQLQLIYNDKALQTTIVFDKF